MNLTVERVQGVSVVRVNEPRLLYPVLAEFTDSITSLFHTEGPRVLLDLSAVTYADSATIGCLMDLERKARAAGGALKLTGVQKRVETVLAMTGAQSALEVYPDQPAAVRAFERQ